MRLLSAREPETPLFAIGFSLGGNVLLKWLGETGGASAIQAAATISVLYDLAAASRFLERRVGDLYARHFMERLKAKALDTLARYFGVKTAQIDPERIRAARTLREFDDCLTAPLHGFASAEAYYSAASSLPYPARIEIPTLCISAADDPIIPGESAERARQIASPKVTFMLTQEGGHAGFATGPGPGARSTGRGGKSAGLAAGPHGRGRLLRREVSG